MVDNKKSTEPVVASTQQPKRAQVNLGSPVGASAVSPTSSNVPPRTPANMMTAASTTGGVASTGALKIDKQNLISVGLIGALTNNGFSSAVTMPNLLLNAEDSNFNKRLLSRYGCYLIVILIDPSEFGEMVKLKVLLKKKEKRKKKS